MDKSNDEKADALAEYVSKKLEEFGAKFGEEREEYVGNAILMLALGAQGLESEARRDYNMAAIALYLDSENKLEVARKQ